jgi:hypothetical protein
VHLLFYMDFIYEIPNNLSKEFCESVIKKFNEDKHLHKKGKIGISPFSDKPSGFFMEDLKDTREMFISDLEDWKEIDKVFYEALRDGIKKYTDVLTKCLRPIFNNEKALKLSLDSMYLDILQDKGYNIQRVIKNDGWHHDSNITGGKVLVGIWYLNTIPKENGGATEFIHGRKVQPEAGKLVLYPASWHHIHRGGPFKGTEKYICTVSLFPNV